MPHSMPPLAISDCLADEPRTPHRLADQMQIDAGLTVQSPLLRAFDAASRAADAERAEATLRALHQMVDDAFERQLKTMFATDEAFQRLLLEAAQPAEGHRAH